MNYFQLASSSLGAIALGWVLLHSPLAPSSVSEALEKPLFVSQQPSTLSSSAQPLPESVADAVKQDIAQETGRSPDTLKIVESARRTWPDGCLGLADEEEICTLSLVPGWLVAVEGEGQRWIYRTNDTGTVVRQQAAGQIQAQGDWKVVTQVVRLQDDAGDIEQLAILTDILSKPQTRYANAVYQLFAYHNDRWIQVYNTTGARLISADEVEQSLPPEVIDVATIRDALRAELGQQVDVQALDFRAVVQFRYDTQEVRDQTLQFSHLTQYSGLTTFRSIRLTQFRTVFTRAQQLRIVQNAPSQDAVIARLSVQQRINDRFLSEQFIGDFQVNLDQSIQLVDGLTPGDRLVVRLFDLDQQLIGYSILEVQAQATDMVLVMSGDRTSGVVRTVYGRDVNQDQTLETREIRYDYFTEISQVSRSYQRTEVQFLETTTTVSAQRFTVAGLPDPPTNCVYPASFRTGSADLVNRRLSVIQSGIAELFATAPQTLAQTVIVSATSIIQVYQSISIFTEETTERDRPSAPPPPSRTRVTIEKTTNGQDADRPNQAVPLAVGEPVEWVYRVTNEGTRPLDLSEITVSDDQGITPVFDERSDNGGDRRLSPGETWRYRASGVAEDLSLLLDFETDGRGNPLQAGTLIDDEYANLGLRISTPTNRFGAMLFDSANPTGGDDDLRTSDQGLILILSEDGDSSDPDDAAQGGIIRFSWQRPVHVNYALGVIDADENEVVGTVTTYRANGSLIDVYNIRGIGNQSLQRIPIDDRNVARMDIELAGSGAITGVSVDQVYQNIGRVDVNGERAFDRSHYRNP
ncbi:MAG: hypothetical protein VKL39_02360 [Leptolyngbyaceae bacterium]|nr:hypothetical protein [Leptolyngbyaceae bacterium]